MVTTSLSPVNNNLAHKFTLKLSALHYCGKRKSCTGVCAKQKKIVCIMCYEIWKLCPNQYTGIYCACQNNIFPIFYSNSKTKKNNRSPNFPLKSKANRLYDVHRNSIISVFVTSWNNNTEHDKIICFLNIFTPGFKRTGAVYLATCENRMIQLRRLIAMARFVYIKKMTISSLLLYIY